MGDNGLAFCNKADCDVLCDYERSIVGRSRQKLPRSLARRSRAPKARGKVKHFSPRQWRRGGILRRIGGGSAVLVVIAITAMTVTSVAIFAAFGRNSRAAGELRVDRAVSSLLGGIQQRGDTLGTPGAPFTLEVFADLECHDSREWFTKYLPGIVRELVRPGVLKIQYRSFKTDTIWPKVFVNQQTAALAAGAQGKMWNYIETFYEEQGVEYTRYATEQYLDGLARQIKGLNLDRWHHDRSGWSSEQVVADGSLAGAVGFHNTPSFLMGRSGGELHRVVGSSVVIDLGKKRPTRLVTLQNLLAIIGIK